jgi:hypothetical protein
LPKESHPREEALINTNKKAGKKTRFRIIDYSLNSNICGTIPAAYCKTLCPQFEVDQPSVCLWPITSKRESGIFSDSHGAGNGIRTRDTKLGKLVLYQLSYARL